MTQVCIAAAAAQAWRCPIPRRELRRSRRTDRTCPATKPADGEGRVFGKELACRGVLHSKARERLVVKPSRAERESILISHRSWVEIVIICSTSDDIGVRETGGRRRDGVGLQRTKEKRSAGR
eukprot:3386325-Pleurochrysis_carterae.AAC.1